MGAGKDAETVAAEKIPTPGAESSEPPKRKRGRPTKEEAARKKAASGDSGPKKTRVQLPPEMLEVLGNVPLLLAAMGAEKFAEVQLGYPPELLKQNGANFKAWSDTWEFIELSPGGVYLAGVVATLAAGIITAQPIPRAEKAVNSTPAPAVKPPPAEEKPHAAADAASSPAASA